MGHTTFTDEKLQNKLKKITIKDLDRNYKHYDRTYKRLKRVILKMYKTDGTAAYYRIAEAYMDLAEKNEKDKNAYLKMAKSNYESYYTHTCDEDEAALEEFSMRRTFRKVGRKDWRMRSISILEDQFGLQKTHKEDGSDYYFYLTDRSFEFCGTTYRKIIPFNMYGYEPLKCYFVACTNTESGEVAYRPVTSLAELNDLETAYYNR